MYYIVANEISLIGNLIDSNTIQLHSNWHISHLHLKITHHKGLHICNFLIYFMISIYKFSTKYDPFYSLILVRFELGQSFSYYCLKTSNMTFYLSKGLICESST